MNSRIIPIALCAALFSAANLFAYDPLALPESPKPPAPVDLTIQDSARNREIPLRVFLPATTDAAPVVLFSHGLGGTREGSPYLGEHWSARGYVVVYLQHHGSDDEVWKNKSNAERGAALKAAINLQNFVLRLRDVPVTFDQLAKWNKESGHVLSGRLDMEHVGMSGHSFGAATTQGVSGQTFPTGSGFTDPRIRAAIAFSPSSPSAIAPEKSFGSVKIPWMLMTGTKDVIAISPATVESRLAVFPTLPPGDKYELVLDKAEHSAFTDRPLPGDSEPRNPNHHRVILALSTAFWDTYLRKDTQAKEWLQSDAPRKLMEAKDKWQKK